MQSIQGSEPDGDLKIKEREERFGGQQKNQQAQGQAIQSINVAVEAERQKDCFRAYPREPWPVELLEGRVNRRRAQGRYRDQPWLQISSRLGEKKQNRQSGKKHVVVHEVIA